MTNEEKMAHEYAIENWEHYEEGQSDYDALKQAHLAGQKASKPKWHKPSEKLPAECSLVLAFDFEDSEPSLFKFVASNTWEWMPRRIVFLSNDQIKCWCEIPQYTEE